MSCTLSSLHVLNREEKRRFIRATYDVRNLARLSARPDYGFDSASPQGRVACANLLIRHNTNNLHDGN